MRMPPLPADFIHARACKLKCEKILTRPFAPRVWPLTMDKAVPIPYIESTEPRSTSCGASLFVPTANHHTKSCIVRRENQLLTERQKVLCNHSLYNLVEMFISPFAGDNRPSELFLDICLYQIHVTHPKAGICRNNYAFFCCHKRLSHPAHIQISNHFWESKATGCSL